MKKIALRMRRCLYVISLIVVFTCCSKKDDINEITQNTTKDTSKITLNITDTLWYLTRTNYGGGMIYLKIAGSTNGDKVTIRTYGDGLRGDLNIELDSKKKFNKDVVIAFTATSVPSGEFEVNTKVSAYKGGDTLVVPLYSGKLKY